AAARRSAPSVEQSIRVTSRPILAACWTAAVVWSSLAGPRSPSMKMRPAAVLVTAAVICLPPVLPAATSQPTRARHGMVVSQDFIASEIGAQALADGRNAVYAAART